MKKKFLIFFIYVTGLILVGVISFEIASIRGKHSLYREDLGTRILNVDIFRDALEKLNGKEYDKAISVLETAMLMEATGSTIDEKVLGQNKDIQDMAKKVSEYCSKYNVFDGKTNLPSHFMAKQFLDSHTAKQ
jgi:hypothetical protein